jgi:hypothetical protein
MIIVRIIIYIKGIVEVETLFTKIALDFSRPRRRS